MGKLFALFCGMALGFPAQAVVLVELFTAEACEPCRDAEAVVSELSAGDDVLAIAYHVDYWDFLGEPDPFANANFGARQVGYNHTTDLKEVHTPQIIVAGQEHFVANQSAAMQKSIEELAAEDPLNLHLKTTDSGFIAELMPTSLEAQAGFEIVLLEIYSDENVAALAAGKETNSTIPIAKSISSLGSWDGLTPLTLQIENPNGARLMLFVQRADFGKIVFAQELSQKN